MDVRAERKQYLQKLVSYLQQRMGLPKRRFVCAVRDEFDNGLGMRPHDRKVIGSETVTAIAELEPGRCQSANDD
ncbi:hypothetical protein M3P05_16845 [Sansalvadorimonas sp. 2012CJ34-2]|uniref:Uncharacterized protein n=1 Tax=Parendozoicomonas callyspongiae TaxID=2942213 RepID=A0ABT0PKS7_9GAMM|nr:hypothetical protein [Sansalvadorimonas sp. 2012CJ34-2]MCL6271586.1 hypothetical protein [Sansalvadorimonas sp. 2012CJ34-2]